MHQGTVQGKQENHKGMGGRVTCLTDYTTWQQTNGWTRGVEVGVCGGEVGGRLVATRVSSRCDDADALPCSFSTLAGPRCFACSPVPRPPDPYPLLFVAAADGAGRADMREDLVCSGVVRRRTSGSQDGPYLRAMPICAWSGLQQMSSSLSRESRPGARRVSLPPRASALLNAGVETATVDGMGCDGDGRDWEWMKLLGDSTARQIPKFQPGGFRSSAASLMAAGRGWDRIQGAVDSGGGCEGAGARENAPAAATAAGRCTGAPLRAALFHAPKGERRREPQMGGGLQLGPRHHCIFGLVPRKQPPFLHLFNGRSATWIRILFALNFLCLLSTMDEIRNSAHGGPSRPISLTKRDEISVSRKKTGRGCVPSPPGQPLIQDGSRRILFPTVANFYSGYRPHAKPNVVLSRPTTETATTL